MSRFVRACDEVAEKNDDGRGKVETSVTQICVQTGSTRMHMDGSGIRLMIEKRTKDDLILHNAVVHGGRWEDSDMSREMENGITIFDRPQDSASGDERPVTCLRIVESRRQIYVRGMFTERSENGVGYMWSMPKTLTESYIFIEHIKAFMRNGKSDECTVLHVLLEVAESSGMLSDSSIMDAEGEKDSSKSNILVELIVNKEDISVVHRMVFKGDKSGDLDVVCQSCYVMPSNSTHGGGDRIAVAEGVWLAVGVSSNRRIVPEVLCGQLPSYSLACRTKTESTLRIDFADTYSVCIPDLFKWRTKSCALSIMPEVTNIEDPDFMILALAHPHAPGVATDVFMQEPMDVPMSANKCRR
jgi:hypothetical protein